MDVQQCKKIFERYGGMMRTKELEQEKIYYKNIQQLIEAGYVEKVRYGYYQWVNPNDFSEIGTVCRLFPDAIFCMDTALRYYGYSDRTPGEWHLAVSKDSGKSRFRIDYPFVKPYYIEPAVLCNRALQRETWTGTRCGFMIRTVSFAIACGIGIKWTKKFSTRQFKTILQTRRSVFPNSWSMPTLCG